MCNACNNLIDSEFIYFFPGKSSILTPKIHKYLNSFIPNFIHKFPTIIQNSLHMHVHDEKYYTPILCKKSYC